MWDLCSFSPILICDFFSEIKAGMFRFCQGKPCLLRIFRNFHNTLLSFCIMTKIQKKSNITVWTVSVSCHLKSFMFFLSYGTCYQILIKTVARQNDPQHNIQLHSLHWPLRLCSIVKICRFLVF